MMTSNCMSCDERRSDFFLLFDGGRVVLASKALTHMMALRFLSIMSAVAAARAYNNGMAVLIPPPCLCVYVCVHERGVKVCRFRCHVHSMHKPCSDSPLSRLLCVASCGPPFVHRGPTLVS
jgi:hypothetical protein